jgi:hypothetical protein
MAHHEALSTLPATGTTDPDGHRYATISVHRTSEGPVSYQRCTCGSWRVTRRPATGHATLEAEIATTRRVTPQQPQPLTAVTTPQAALPPESPVAWVSASGPVGA